MAPTRMPYPEVPPPGDDKLADEKYSVSSGHNLEGHELTSWEGVSFTAQDVSGSLYTRSCSQRGADQCRQSKMAARKVDLILIR
jgi:hypothetical protein